MRTFYRASPEYATILFTEKDGKDMSSSTVQAGLSPTTSPITPPTTWETPAAVTRPTLPTIRASLLIDASRTPGDYYLWIKVADNPETLVRAATDESIRII